jgi:hypothetical protein
MRPKTTARAPSHANGAPKGRFKKGDSKPRGSGRKRGTPNRSGTLKEAVIAAANFVGEKRLSAETGKYEPGNGGLVGYMEHLALHNEPAFGRLLARVLPRVKPEAKPECI